MGGRRSLFDWEERKTFKIGWPGDRVAQTIEMCGGHQCSACGIIYECHEEYCRRRFTTGFGCPFCQRHTRREDTF